MAIDCRLLVNVSLRWRCSFDLAGTTSGRTTGPSVSRRARTAPSAAFRTEIDDGDQHRARPTASRSRGAGGFRRNDRREPDFHGSSFAPPPTVRPGRDQGGVPIGDDGSSLCSLRPAVTMRTRRHHEIRTCTRNLHGCAYLTPPRVSAGGGAAGFGVAWVADHVVLPDPPCRRPMAPECG